MLHYCVTRWHWFLSPFYALLYAPFLSSSPPNRFHWLFTSLRLTCRFRLFGPHRPRRDSGVLRRTRMEDKNSARFKIIVRRAQNVFFSKFCLSIDQLNTFLYFIDYCVIPADLHINKSLMESCLVRSWSFKYRRNNHTTVVSIGRNHQFIFLKTLPWNTHRYIHE